MSTLTIPSSQEGGVEEIPLTPKVDVIQQQLKTLQAQIEGLKAQQCMQKQFARTCAEASEDKLPTLAPAEVKESMEDLGLVYQMLSYWHTGDAMPFTASQAAQHAGLEEDEFVSIMEMALGRSCDGWGVAKDGKAHGDLVRPRQCCYLAHQSLAKLKESYDELVNVADLQEKARIACVKMTEQGKKRSVE